MLAYQCKRRVCKKADKPSIMTKMARVKTAQAANTTYSMIEPVASELWRPLDNTMFHNTSDNSGRESRLLAGHCLGEGFGTYVHEPMKEPTIAGRRPCGR